MGKTNDFGAGGRPVISRRGLALCLLALAACIGVYALYGFPPGGGSGATARLHLDGEEVLSIPLLPEDDYRIPLLERYGMPGTLEVRGGQVRFIEVDCPDHICEKTGFIGLEGQTAVCMPNRAALVITD